VLAYNARTQRSQAFSVLLTRQLCFQALAFLILMLSVFVCTSLFLSFPLHSMRFRPFNQSPPCFRLHISSALFSMHNPHSLQK
jgi:hypothetical protein